MLQVVCTQAAVQQSGLNKMLFTIGKNSDFKLINIWSENKLIRRQIGPDI